jgi:site-specific recombinase XerD
MGATVYRNQIIKSAVAADLTPYCLRHTYCTDLQNAGVPINVAKYLMGHSNISVTVNIYTHTTEKTLREAAQFINAATDNMSHT